MSELTCNECKSPLTGEILDDWTTCPSCGRRWQLTQEHDAIRSVTLVVHPARHKHINYHGAIAFINWVTSAPGQEIIKRFKKDGQPLFYPR